MSTTAEIIRIEELVGGLLGGSLSPLGRAHLQRAVMHLSEAYIAEDGQKARSVEQLLKDTAVGEARDRHVRERPAE